KTNLTHTLQAQIEQLETILNEHVEDSSSVAHLHDTLATRYHFIKEEVHEVEKQQKTDIEQVAIIHSEQEENNIDSELTSEQIITHINQTIDHIKVLPDFDSLIEDLQSKKHRIEDRSLTIALFGAFSAGKSSFSNAL